MNKKILLWSLLASATCSVQAQETFSPSTIKNLLQADGAQLISVREVADPQQFDGAKYGEAKIILHEDFSKLTTGSVDSPDRTTVLTYTDEEREKLGIRTPWRNMKVDYTLTPGWGMHNGYSANGSLFMDGSEFGHINTPVFDTTEGDGIFFVRFSVRTLDGTINTAGTEAAETYNYAAGWDFFPVARLPEFTSEWKTFECMFKFGKKNSMINIFAAPSQDAEHPNPNWLIDDIYVYVVKQFVPTPRVIGYKNYTGRSFDVMWTKREGVDSYLLNVWKLGLDGNPDYLVQDKEVTDTIYNVTGARSGVPYYFDVRAKKGDRISIISNFTHVFALETPELNDLEASTAADGSFTDQYTATWYAVPGATQYKYYTYAERKVQEDGAYAITSEDFTGVKNPETKKVTNYTIESTNIFDVPKFPYYPGSDLKQKGWGCYFYSVFKDFIGFDAFDHVMNKQKQGLVSPEMDFSRDNGKITLNFDVYAKRETWGEETNTASFAVGLYNWNEDLKDYEQVELVYIDKTATGDTKPVWQNYTVNFTKGTKRSVVALWAVRFPAWIFLDNLKITQNLKKDDVVLDPIFYKEFITQPEVTVTIPENEQFETLHHAVKAFGSTKVANNLGSTTEVTYETGLSTSKKFREGTLSVPVLEDVANPLAAVRNGLLNIVNPQGDVVSVYTTDGSLVFTNNSGNKTISTQLEARGLYIVKVGNKTIKVMY